MTGVRKSAASQKIANCDFCFRPARANVLSGRRWFKPWQRPRWYFVCPEHLRVRRWEHG
jgi:hypothetical protein